MKLGIPASDRSQSGDKKVHEEESDCLSTPRRSNSSESGNNAPAISLETIACRIETHVSEQLKCLENRFLFNVSGDITKLAAEISAIHEALREVQGLLRNRQIDFGQPVTSKPIFSSKDFRRTDEAPACEDDVVEAQPKSNSALRGKAIVSRFSVRPSAHPRQAAAGRSISCPNKRCESDEATQSAEINSTSQKQLHKIVPQDSFSDRVTNSSVLGHLPTCDLQHSPTSTDLNGNDSGTIFQGRVEQAFGASYLDSPIRIALNLSLSPLHNIH